jgi:predicted secreted protein
MKNGIGIHQLPCPEFRYLGISREPMTKEEYDTKEYRQICKNISIDTIEIMKEYVKNKYEIIGLIGVNESPTCSIINSRGIFIEELLSLINDNNLSIKKIDVPVDYKDGENNSKFIKALIDFFSFKIFENKEKID